MLVLLPAAGAARAAVLYVDANSTNAAPPYTNLATAAVIIQDAVDTANPGDTVLVRSGVYNSGGRPVNGYALTNRVAVDKPLTLLSLDGPEATVIQGHQMVPGPTNGDYAVRCVYLTNGATLAGFTLTSGATRSSGDGVHEQSGGGVWCESASASVLNCFLQRNTASQGGGAYSGSLLDCILSGNIASEGGGIYGGWLADCELSSNTTWSLGRGGGAEASTLLNCTLTGNSAWGGGGALTSTLYSCTLKYNSAYMGGGGAGASTMYYCLFESNSASAGGGGVGGGTLYNCILNGNRSSQYGGASYSGILNNCVLCSNRAAFFGGGAFRSTLNNCTLSGNTAYDDGGGADQATLNNCVLSGNSAQRGGGVAYSTLNNCTLTGNSANNGGGAYWGTLTKCVLNGNWATNQGGGTYVATVDHCILTGNSATGLSGSGGGAGGGRLSNCLLTSNSATGYGGGSAGAFMTNCTLVGNWATDFGGGADGGDLNNCIVYYNVAPRNANYQPQFGYPSTLYYCCTTPLPTNGVGNITNAPLFVDLTGGDLRLQSNSPCINSGNNACIASSTDLDGNPRMSGGTVDIGAYEFQNPSSVISYAWLQQYGLSIDGTADYADPDGDDLNNWQEWIAGTDPTSALSVLKMLSPGNGVSGVAVTWQSVTNRLYFLQRCTDFGVQPPFSTVQSNIVGLAGTTSYTDTTATNGGPYLYRIGVRRPVGS